MAYPSHKNQTADDLKRAYQNCGHEFDKNYPAKARESKGPCPLCGGTDRFHIAQGDTKPLMYCRQCNADFKDFLAVLGVLDKPELPAPPAPRQSSASGTVVDLAQGTPFTPPQNARQWHYYDSEGSHKLTTFRTETPDGKEFRQAVPDGKGGYLTGNLPKVRPLLHSEHLARIPKTEPVLIVEGEKCVEAAIAQKHPATTWPGGCGNVKKVDLSVLEGRPVILWPDADEPGEEAMRSLAKRLPKSCQTFWIEPPNDKPEKWDCADADADTFRQLIHDAKPYQPTDGMSLVDITRIPVKPTQWLWHHFIPRGEITVLAGRGSAGKSTLAMTFAAIVASGGKWPDGSSAQKGKVVILNTEDDFKSTLASRSQMALEAIGAKDWMPIETETWKVHQSIAEALPKLLGLLASYEHPPSLLVIDPIIEIMTSGNSNSAHDVRKALQPIQNFAKQTGMSILGITHLAKYTTDENAVERVLGSNAWTTKPRALLLAHYDSESADPRKLLRAKSNLGPEGGGFEYEIKVDEREWVSVKFGKALTGDADTLTKRRKGLSQDEIAFGDQVTAEQQRLFQDGQRPDWGLFPSTAFNAATGWHPRKAKEYRELRGYGTRQAKDPHSGWWWYEEGENDPEST